VEVKIGVQYATRELVVESTQTPDEVQAAVAAALSSRDGILSLVDEKGRLVVVPAATLAYVEIAPESAVRRVGFAGS
jgi:hypothetical protein